MTRRASKVDDNQPQIVKALRAAGASVQILSAVGQGCPDLLVGFRGDNFALEVKDGNKPKSARELTPDQRVWHLLWRGRVEVVTCVEDALMAIGIRRAS